MDIKEWKIWDSETHKNAIELFNNQLPTWWQLYIWIVYLIIGFIIGYITGGN